MDQGRREGKGEGIERKGDRERARGGPIQRMQADRLPALHIQRTPPLEEGGPSATKSKPPTDKSWTPKRKRGEHGEGRGRARRRRRRRRQAAGSRSSASRYLFWDLQSLKKSAGMKNRGQGEQAAAAQQAASTGGSSAGTAGTGETGGGTGGISGTGSRDSDQAGSRQHEFGQPLSILGFTVILKKRGNEHRGQGEQAAAGSSKHRGQQRWNCWN